MGSHGLDLEGVSHLNILISSQVAILALQIVLHTDHHQCIAYLRCSVSSCSLVQLLRTKPTFWQGRRPCSVMPSVHPRSPSPANHANCKRAKVTHQSSANGLNGTNGSREKAEDDVATQFTPELFDHNHIAKLRGTYQNSTPWKYAVLESLFNDDLLKSVKDECRSELSFTEKETDIYKVTSFDLFLRCSR